MPPKANTKAKVTKPAEPAKKTAATRKAPAKATATKAAATKKTAATKKATEAPAKKAAATKKEPAKAPAKSAAPKATTSKRKREEEPEEAPAKKAKTTTTKKAATKTSAEKEAPAKPVKKAKALTKGAVINEPPTERLHVFVFGEGTAGELGLGTAKNAVDVKRPRLNPNLAADKVGVVQIAAGGMHVVALTHDNKILTWGVNDQGALGRDTEWEGGLKDMDEAQKEEDEESDSDDDEDNNGLNPKESLPAEVDFTGVEVAEDTRWVQVAAGDSCSLALTDDGRVYGWGTFRGNEGTLGFTQEVETATRPMLLPELKNITSIVAGANHALALNKAGAVVAWGSGQQMQLGRRIIERSKLESLRPREFGLPKGPKNGIATIETGAYHCFAISKNGNVYSWGLNNYGETGIPDNAGQDDAAIKKPTIVEALQGKGVTNIKGGGHHSMAATENGDCLIWGRIDGAQGGFTSEELQKMPEDVVMRDHRNDPRILLVPTKVEAVKGATTKLAPGPEHNLVVTKEGKAWSWGFSANYQTGLGTEDDVLEPTLIENSAVKEKTLNGVFTGGQYSILTAAAQ
ncbi:RCC1/BLIP-II protein [Hortaea werneckii]|uniref:RCC1-like domain-containing protein n=1 Tax=Hortaea werneckii TaxID=91943 RepID=A0A3M7F3V0_HORWE|nr:RCC1/BLIP-II protein [Hortaea werneckii]RMY83226.1 hypothetical protein D0861_07533 [Hortaea werneckii]